MSRLRYGLLCIACWLPFRRLWASSIMAMRCHTFQVTGKGVIVVFVDKLGREWSTMLHGPGDWRQGP